MLAGLARQFRLGQHVYFVLWDDETSRAAVACGEVVEYASDHTKVRVKVIDSPHPNLAGRTTWILPERVDDSPSLARLHYQRRARQSVREDRPAVGTHHTGERSNAVSEAQILWGKVLDGWGDIDFFLETMDYETGWAENEERVARYALLATHRLRPTIEALLAHAEGQSAAADVREALSSPPLALAQQLAPNDACALLDRWNEVNYDVVSEVANAVRQLRGSLAALGRAAELLPELAAEEDA